MGVFAVFRRKKKDVVEASSEETGVAGTPVDDATEAGADTRAETEITAESEAVAEVRVEVGAGAGAGGADVVEATADDADAAEGLDTDEEAAGAVASEVVEIPKQQSAEAAADNEAGEGARK
ncbi:hypothetical protein ACWGQ4_26255 [Streptomyces sp. NPDC055721]|uniref:hypothetical protein n=1 Tax=Streptomyces sp. NPDC127132 TaxID=3345374 RepID=UPI00364013D1